MDLEHSSKHSETCSVKEAKSDQMYGETFDHSIKDDKPKIFPETTDNGHPSSNDSSHEGRSSSDSSEGKKDVISRGENGKNNYSDTHINGTKSESSAAGRSSSPFSSESSMDDFFGMEEAFKYTKAGTLESKSGKDCVSSSESSDKSDNIPLVPTSTCQVYNSSSSQKVMSPTTTPPIQVMDRSATFEASVVPSSVFEVNTNPSEWSIASNDSLFSIQIGQSSFSRENVFMFGELGLSGDLTKCIELNNGAPSVIEEEPSYTSRKGVDVEKQQATETSHEAFKLEGEKLSEEDNKIKTSHQTASSKSSKSNASILSRSCDTGIALPSKKRSRKLGYNCSWMFCNLCPNCNCSNGFFSCCWNGNPTKYHQHISPVSTEAEGNDSTKMDIPQQQSKQESEVISDSKQPSEVTPNSSGKDSKWFHCFSCSSCTWMLSCTTCK
ncbi:hypothetical protein CR513_49560, partial [Mucuna pruriens]